MLTNIANRHTETHSIAESGHSPQISHYFKVIIIYLRPRSEIHRVGRDEGWGDGQTSHSLALMAWSRSHYWSSQNFLQSYWLG